MVLWQDVAHEGCNTIGVAELKELWASSTLFQTYFHSMDIDLGFLEYVLTSLDLDGHGLVSFEQFARAVVGIKDTDPGPVSAFIKHSILDVLKEVSSVKAQCESYHQDVLKRISQSEAVTAAYVTAAAGMSSSKSECVGFHQDVLKRISEGEAVAPACVTSEAARMIAARGMLSTAITSPLAAQTATPTSASTATPMARKETLARARLLEHRSFQTPTKAFHPAQVKGQLVPRHLNVDDVKPAIPMDHDIEERVRIEPPAKHLMVDIRMDCLGHMKPPSASLSEALPCYVPPRSPREVPSLPPMTTGSAQSMRVVTASAQAVRNRNILAVICGGMNRHERTVSRLQKPI